MTLAPDYQNCVFGVHQHHRTFLILLLSTFFTSLCFVDQHRKYRSRPVQLISLGRISKRWDSRKPYRYNRFGAQDFKVQQVKRGNTQRCWTLKSKLMQVSSSFIHKPMQNRQVTALGKTLRGSFPSTTHLWLFSQEPGCALCFCSNFGCFCLVLL